MEQCESSCNAGCTLGITVLCLYNFEQEAIFFDCGLVTNHREKFWISLAEEYMLLSTQLALDGSISCSSELKLLHSHY